MAKLSVPKWKGLSPEAPRFLFDITQGDKPLDIPLGVATYGNKVFVADSGNGLVQVFDADGRFLRSFPVKAKEKETVFRPPYPVGIAIDDEGNVYVSDVANRKVLVFDSSGKYLQDFPKEGGEVLKRPLSVTFAADKLYTTDVDDHKVKVFSSYGKLLRDFGGRGAGEGQFAYPNGVAVDKEGNIYVADSNNGRVQLFDEYGGFVKVFAKSLILPRGIAVDDLGRVHVVDTFAKKVFIYDMEGKLLFTYGHEGKDGRELQLPNDIAINNDVGRFYIADRGKDRVSAWGY